MWSFETKHASLPLGARSTVSQKSSPARHCGSGRARSVLRALESIAGAVARTAQRHSADSRAKPDAIDCPASAAAPSLTVASRAALAPSRPDRSCTDADLRAPAAHAEEAHTHTRSDNGR